MSVSSPLWITFSLYLAGMLGIGCLGLAAHSLLR
jgi:hypothetical protein